MRGVIRHARAGLLGMAGVLALATGCVEPALAAPTESIVSSAPVKGGLALVEHGTAVPILLDPDEPAVTGIAARDLASDIATVTGQKPEVRKTATADAKFAIIVGTLGQSRLIDAMARSGRLATAQVAGKWESFLIATVDSPLPGVSKALVIAGSDRRGTAYGVYEVSQAIGVSPWAWWADVTPRHRDALYVAPGLRRFGPPSVRYRGVFVNDEDWGLYPWAVKTFDPAYKDIGPKTYARIFELLLRLKANTLWPAMHKTTKAFNLDPENAKLADEYAIVMGSSHSEAMLRNNVGEWTAPAKDYNYATNRDGVRTYWEERVRANAGYENIWTIGMRGVHDLGMIGTSSMAEKVALVDQAITDQRAMLDRHVPGGSAKAAQIFIPYKEVLDIYRAGLKVPDNVTIVWPDDNFGYIRQFPSRAEATRSGGAGVYYHLSYLGYPLAYLWLSTTPPALVREEMVRAYDQGSHNLWVINVGDIKPAEIGTTQFLDMAWDIGRWRDTGQKDYLRHWLGDAFASATIGDRAATMMDAYYRLNFERRPEHLEWPAHEEDRHLSSYTPAEVNDRLRRWRGLAAEAQAFGKSIPADRQDAWFELVEFPIRAAAAANVRFFAAERYDELVEVDPPMARSAGGAVAWAEDEIKALTDRFNNHTANGKWRYIMPAEPADSQWRIYRPRPIVAPAEALRTSPDAFFAAVDHSPDPASAVVEAEDTPARGWHLIEGLGRGRGVLMADKPGASWSASFTLSHSQSVDLGILPLFPDGEDRELKLDVSIDGGPVQSIAVPRKVGSAEWVSGVLDNLLKVPVSGPLQAGQHRIVVAAKSGGIALDRLLLKEPEAGQASH